jgi:uncharacterized damage-inducible protein DinB
MNHVLADRYRRWFEYEKDSHAQVLATLESVPDAKRKRPAFKKAITLMAHLIAARQLWLFRMGLIAEPPTEFFPEGLSLAELAGQVAAIHVAWTDILGRLHDDALAEMFEYQALDGSWFRNSVEDTLTQLYGHSLYHRGQIAQLLRSLGTEPPSTDFVFWTREPIVR